jgi:integrase
MSTFGKLAPEFVYTRNGNSLDVSGDEWEVKLSRGVRHLKWSQIGLSGNALSGSIRHAKWLVKNYSAGYLCRHFAALTAYGKICFKEDINDLSLAGLSRFRTLMFNEGHHEYVASVRRWYRWCTDAEQAGFDPDVLFAIERWLIPEKSRYLPVRTADLRKGALSAKHDKMLQTAIWAADDYDDKERLRFYGCFTFRQIRAMVAICRFIGCRPEQVRHLNEGDLQVYNDDEGKVAAVLYVPRCKNGLNPRKERVKRKIDITLANLITEAMNDNGHVALNPRYKPMFCRSKPYEKDEGIDCWRARDLTAPFKNWAKAVGLVDLALSKTAAPAEEASNEDTDSFDNEKEAGGENVINIYPRRLRYTFATEHAVNRSPMELAYLLDHTDERTIQHYYAYADDILDRLKTVDDATGWGTLLKFFLGHVKEQEGVTPPKKAIYIPPENIDKYGELVGLGRCGRDRRCQLFPPFSCYTCARFEPDPDAPHEQILADLIIWKKDWPKSIGRSRDSIAVQLDDVIAALGHLTVVLKVYRHLRAIHQAGQAFPDLDELAEATDVEREFIEEDRSIQRYLAGWSETSARTHPWQRRRRGAK